MGAAAPFAAANGTPEAERPRPAPEGFWRDWQPGTTAGFTRYIPILASLNLAETLAFCRDQLGFSGETYADDAIVQREAMGLHFWLTTSGIDAGHTACWLRGGQVPALHAEFAARGVTGLSPFALRPWDVHEFIPSDRPARQPAALRLHRALLTGLGQPAQPRGSSEKISRLMRSTTDNGSEELTHSNALLEFRSVFNVKKNGTEFAPMGIATTAGG